LIAGLLLAAGGASRFGSQKLIAPLGDVPLVRHAFDALAQVVDLVIVVVGSEGHLVGAALHGTAAHVVENPDWARGLSTSIRRGVTAVPVDVDAVLIALGDEPLMAADVSRAVTAAWREAQRPIIVARYAGVPGHPVLFDRSVFGELAALDGDVGARSVIARSPERVLYVDVAAPLPDDVDRPQDLRLLDMHSRPFHRTGDD
jgi:molybdenum cofactor cytidylyltransferase